MKRKPNADFRALPVDGDDEANDGPMELPAEPTSPQDTLMSDAPVMPLESPMIVAAASPVEDDKETWTEEVRAERRKAKKQRKKQKRLDEMCPEFVLNMENYSKTKQNNLKLKDLQNVALWILADGINPSWVMVKNRECISKVIYVMVPNLLPNLLYGSFDPAKPLPPPVAPRAPLLPCIESQFSHVFITKGPADKTRLQSPLQVFFQLPLTQTQKVAMRKEMEARTARSVADFVLTSRQLRDNYYPEAKSPPSKGWVQFGQKEKRTDDYLAMDCEMCYTEQGLEVTRVTLVNEQLETVYDKLVLPCNPIIDYNTKYSGITEEMMRNVDTTLEQVQQELASLIDDETVLIGHSLENDLKALKIHHKRIVDTAVLYHSNRGPPSKPKLSFLAQKHLNRSIQDGEEGHNSAEDAAACMELAKLKLKNGHGFGVVVHETESIFTRLQRSDRKSVMIDTHRSVMQYGADATECREVNNDEEAVEEAIPFLDPESDTSFVWLRLRGLELQGEGGSGQGGGGGGGGTDATPSPAAKQSLGTPTAPVSREVACQQLNQQLEKLVQHAPKNSVILLYSGHGDTEDASVLLQQRAEYQQLCTKYSAARVHQEMPDKVFGLDKMEELEVAVEKAKFGVTVLCLRGEEESPT